MQTLERNVLYGKVWQKTQSQLLMFHREIATDALTIAASFNRNLSLKQNCSPAIVSSLLLQQKKTAVQLYALKRTI